MSLPGCKPRVLPFLCFCLLVLACVVVSQSEGPAGTPSTLTPRLEGSRWSQVRSKVKELVEPMVTRARDRWQKFWGPWTFKGFVQTYYNDHLKDLGPRTKAWLHSSKDTLLDKAHSLCPRLLCGEKDQD
ncbi:apolipoprotein C-IV [Trichechus manatus latirostris]|uniref:Apolipoprotein C-IV n=1 Tax=Trichechus manatus latirostris TaxID=127582 RepID=A0A2Y9E970_TRIMA|nr:apolipoprotein C-IV [Trichechus manatus latirostris]